MGDLKEDLNKFKEFLKPTPKKIVREEILPLEESLDDPLPSKTKISNSLLRTCNLIFTGTERIKGKQTNKRYAQALIKVLKEVD